MYTGRIVTTLLVSAVAHMLLMHMLEQLPETPKDTRPRYVKMTVVPPPPADEPPPPPKLEPEPPKEEPIVQAMPTEQPKIKKIPTRLPPKDATTKNLPPSNHAVTTGETTDQPTFGITQESTSQSGSGPAMPTGNTLQPQADTGPAPEKVKPLAKPAQAYEVTKMPLPRGRCEGKMPEAARDAGIEGTVLVAFIVDENGTTREISVIKGLGHGLDEAAIAAVRACKFKPALKGAAPVAYAFKEFKVTFSLQDDGL